MSFASLWRVRPAKGKIQTARRSFVPRLLALEDRTLPSTFTVLNLNDSGAGSLRQAVLLSNFNPGADTINFAPGLTGTIPLTSGQLTIFGSLAVNGPGADTITVSGSNASRVFAVDGPVNVAISGLTLAAGNFNMVRLGLAVDPKRTGAKTPRIHSVRLVPVKPDN